LRLRQICESRLGVIRTNPIRKIDSDFFKGTKEFVATKENHLY
jgi:hypothetical protein